MPIYKQTGDYAMKLRDEFRRTDPRLHNPLKRAICSALEWAFPDAVFRDVTTPKKDKIKPPEDNTPGGPN